MRTEVHRAQNDVSGFTISQKDNVTLRQNSDRPVSSDKQSRVYIVHGHIDDERPTMA